MQHFRGRGSNGTKPPGPRRVAWLMLTALSVFFQFLLSISFGLSVFPSPSCVELIRYFDCGVLVFTRALQLYFLRNRGVIEGLRVLGACMSSALRAVYQLPAFSDVPRSAQRSCCAAVHEILEAYSSVVTFSVLSQPVSCHHQQYPSIYVLSLTTRY